MDVSNLEEEELQHQIVQWIEETKEPGHTERKNVRNSTQTEPKAFLNSLYD